MELRYTGHPLLDVGVATITAFADKSDPAEVTESDLEAIADYMEREYSKNPMKSFLTVIFPNSGFTQPAFETQPEKRAAYAESVLRAWRTPSTSEERCVFFGTPATRRVFRETLPLVGAESSFNFYVDGQAGLPISGTAMLAIQAFPLGSLKCGGRALLLHAENPDVTLSFARRALQANRNYLSLAAQADKAADSKYPRTQIIARLVEADVERQDYELCSLTAYHLTNYGTSADVGIYHVPLPISRFLKLATDATYSKAWQAIVQRAWERSGDSENNGVQRDEYDSPVSRNVLFEDLFALPTDAQRFLRTHFLRLPAVRNLAKSDPRRTYDLRDEVDLISWPLTRLFMKEVMNVDPERIDAIRHMGDKLAEYINDTGDVRLFRTFLHGRNRGIDYQELRTRLIRADYASARQGKLLFTQDEFIGVFENSEDRFWWLMARDLVLIRMIERLHELHWIADHREELAPASAEIEEEVVAADGAVG